MNNNNDRQTASLPSASSLNGHVTMSRIDPLTGIVVDEQITIGNDEQDDASRFVFFFREDYYRNTVVVKIEVFDGTHWLSGRELSVAHRLGLPTEAATKVKLLLNLLLAHGMDPKLVKRLLERKCVFLNHGDVPLNDVAAQGWSIEPYPQKFGGTGILDQESLLEDFRTHGVHVDASNAIADKAVIETRGLAFKGLLDLTRSYGIPTRAYIDFAAFGWMKREGLHEVFNYLNYLLSDHGPCRMITESKRGESVDPILLDWVDRTNGHALSRDGYEDFDMTYSWILNGASEGKPRLHKFSCDGERIGIPDLGISIEIPTTF